MLTRKLIDVHNNSVGKYGRISTRRVLMLDNSPCDVDSGFHPCWNKDVDDADHADVVDIDSQINTPETDNDNCEVCLIAPRNPRIALVPCGHQRFCSTCADRVRVCVTRDADVLSAERTYQFRVKSVLK